MKLIFNIMKSIYLSQQIKQAKWNRLVLESSNNQIQQKVKHVIDSFMNVRTPSMDCLCRQQLRQIRSIKKNYHNYGNASKLFKVLFVLEVIVEVNLKAKLQTSQLARKVPVSLAA